MQRRDFMKNLAGTAVGVAVASATGALNYATASETQRSSGSLDGYTLLSEFKANGTSWKAYEDLTKRDGDIIFVSAQGVRRVLPKSAEAAFAEAEPAHL